MTRLASLALAPAFLMAAVLFGGASSAGVYANALLQFSAVSIIAGLVLVSGRRSDKGERGLLAILLAGLSLAIVQLIPLPPALWMALPGREIVAETYALAGIRHGWRPLTLSAAGTIGAALAMLPVIAAALIGLRAPRGGVTAAFGAIMLMMCAAVVLGLAQRATGQQSAFYLYQITNRGYAVGFFANGNHFATLCALALPATAAFLAAAAGRIRSKIRWLILLTVIAVAALGIAFSGSLAGIGLAAVGLLASYQIMRRRRDTATPARTAVVIALAAAVLAAGAAFIVLGQIGGVDGMRGAEMGRPVLWERTAQAIAATMPVGTGLGSFTTVYPQFENPMTVTGVYANHAHNDYLETVLTTGVAGIALFVCFLLWFGQRSIAIWTSPTPDPFARAASVMIVMIGLHEIVDYPLRTAAIATIFGLCCGVMARPKHADQPSDPSRRAGRHLSA